MTRILGISAYYHDSAACLVEDGRIIAALQEERFSRRKHDDSLPERAIRAALEVGKCGISDLQYIVFYEKPFARFERLLETYLQHCPRGLRSYMKAMPLWIKKKLWLKDEIRRTLNYEGPILFADHHESHAASAFFPSPFEEAAILTIDGVGEWTTTTLGRGLSNRVELRRDLRFPHSLGLLYSAFTYYLGFRVNSDEYKVMGLAPYGRPVFADLIREKLIELNPDGAFSLNMEYFDYEAGLKMTSERFDRLFGGPPRRKHEPLTERHKDLAASIQRVTEELILRMARTLQKMTGSKNLCLAGGVALNCVANGRLLRESDFERIWIQPAAGDAGGALGSALAVWHRYLEQDRQIVWPDRQEGSLLGTRYSCDEIEEYLVAQGAVYERLEWPDILEVAVRSLMRGGVIGWFQGRMEFGPRALGNRSILADPQKPEMLDEVNRRIKYRESFRPFAPAVLEKEASRYFELNSASPYMLLVSQVRADVRKEIPAVTHVDGSARVQTVDSDTHPRFYQLLETFHSQSGCPVLLNTSFNVKDEPIVESPAQAYRCFMRTGLDLLVLENCVLHKCKQPSGL